MTTSAEQLLTDLGAGTVPHPGGTLLSHLRRVRDLLAEWGASDATQQAGLCHAAYGTDGFELTLLDPRAQRERLRDVIGADAEALVYLYGACDRKRTYPGLDEARPAFGDRFDGALHRPSTAQVRSFVEITAANELDVMRHNPELAQRYGDALVELTDRASRHLSGPARAAWAAWAWRRD